MKRKIKLNKQKVRVINRYSKNYDSVKPIVGINDNNIYIHEECLETIEQSIKIDKMIEEFIKIDSVEISYDINYSFALRYKKNIKSGYIRIDLNIYKDCINLEVYSEIGIDSIQDIIKLYNNSIYLKYEKVLKELYYENLRKNANLIIGKIYEHTNLKRKHLIENILNEN